RSAPVPYTTLFRTFHASTSGQFAHFSGQRPPARELSCPGLYVQLSSAAVFPEKVGAGDVLSDGSPGAFPAAFPSRCVSPSYGFPYGFPCAFSPEEPAERDPLFPVELRAAPCATTSGASPRRRSNSSRAAGCTSWSRLASWTYDSRGTVRNCTRSVGMSRSPRTSSYKPRRLARPGSVVSDEVAASRTGYSFAGFSSTSLLRTLLTSAPRKRCWRSIRSVSLPLPSDLRART